ncbi:BTAD domain-containing putative transcriptional regulator [Jatrophihabitans sp. YIM 134969]
MRVAILGELEVWDADGVARAVPGGRVRALLARLALDAGRVVPTHVLVDEVWGSVPPAEPANALQSLVSRLRRMLGDGGLVVQEAGGYRLALSRSDVDALRLTDLLAEVARCHDSATRDALLQQATELARGPAVPELDSSHEVRLGELVLAAHEQRLALDLADPDADPADLVRRAGDLTRAHPLHEHLTALLMRALQRQGRTPDALGIYDQLRRRLAEELGTDPSTELQALHLELLQDAPAPAPRRARRTNLRASLTSFIGRDDEAKRVDTLLEQGRLATVVGPGGAGKTRLAGVVAAGWVDRMADGVWFVELAPVTDAAALPQAFLGSLGVQVRDVLERRAERPALGSRDRLTDTLAEATCLLVVDNCEHLIGAVADLVDELLAECPGLRVLATSREPLGIDGEALCLLPPLLLPRPNADPATALRHASVALFADRARAVDASFTVDAGTVHDVVDIVRRLDGLPLAIELAAARLRVLPVTAVAERLSDRFRLLTGGSRTAMPRHRTLRAVVEWSWDLLSPDERALAERLAVFPGGATVSSAAAVGATAGLDEVEVADLLDALVDKSLLRVETADGLRYLMLETIREYGVERLVAAGVVDEVRRAHALHFAALVHEASPHLHTADQLPWIGRLEADMDNVLAALQHLVATDDGDTAVALVSRLALYWLLVGQHTESSTWVRASLGAPGGDAADRLLCECLIAVNAFAGGVGVSPEDDVAVGPDALVELGRRIDAYGLDRDHQELVLMRPMLEFFTGRAEQMRVLMDASLQLADDWTAAAIIMFRGNLAENEGDIEGMRRDTEAAYERFERLGERWGMASALTSWAQLNTLDGRFDAAIAQYERAERHLAEFGAVGDLVFARARVAELYLRRGDTEAARREWRRISEVATSRPERLLADNVLAAILRIDGDVDGVRTARDRMLDHVQALGPLHPLNGHMTAMTLSSVISLDLWLGEDDAATALVADAYVAGVGTKDMPVLAGVGRAVAVWLQHTGQPVPAATALGASEVLHGRLDATDPRVQELIGLLRADLGDDGFAAAFETGRQLPRDAAAEALDPRPYLSVTAP